MEVVELRTGTAYVFHAKHAITKMTEITTTGDEKARHASPATVAAVASGSAQSSSGSAQSSKPQQPVSYEVAVKTSNCSGAGTDANVSICVWGASGDTGNRVLERSSTHKNKFETNQTDIFQVGVRGRVVVRLMMRMTDDGVEVVG